nr:hypothetical protein Hi04_10k_c5966_00020 [uncultured bacterium]
MLALVSRKILALFLVIVFPSTLVMADRPSAMLTTSGTVRLNGTALPQSTSVFTGDVIDTAAESVGSLSRSGSSVIVDPDSSVRYQDDGVSVVKGMARVQTSKGMAAHVGRISVIPVGSDALFDVHIDGKTALIASRKGPLTLTDGVESFTLDPGHTAKVSIDVSQDQGQAPKPAAKGGEKKLKKPPAWLIWVVVAGGAFAVACALTCGSGAAAISPVVP